MNELTAAQQFSYSRSVLYLATQFWLV